MRSKPTNSGVTPPQVLTDNVSSIGRAIHDLFLEQAGNPSVSGCDDLLHALAAAETATRKLRVRLAQEVSQHEK